jgi:hypothetical protein
MKNKILLLVITLISLITFSQEIADNTIGLRFGDDDGLGAEISYQKSLSENNRVELGLAWRNGNNFSIFKLTGTYQWVFDFSEITEGMNWYVGAGGGLGSFNLDDNIGEDGIFLFASGVIGIDYAFDFPLLLSLDIRPEIGFANFNNDFGIDIALGVRYIIN